MLFYREKLPKIGTIVVAQIIPDEENENCFYVILPEYNNYRGIIYKTHLPKRLKIYKKTINDMKQAGLIVCCVSNSPNFDCNMEAELIELSVKCYRKKKNDDDVHIQKSHKKNKDDDSNDEHYTNIVTRYKNIEKIIKIVKFISIRYHLDYEQLISKFHDTILVPLLEINEDGVNNYNELYNEYLRNIDNLLNLMQLNNECDNKFDNEFDESNEFDEKTKDNIDIRSDVKKELSALIKETEASSTLEFDILIWNTNEKDAIFILRDVFGYMKNKFPNTEYRYIGSPKYQICIQSIEYEKIDDIYKKIEKSVIKWFKDHNISTYSLKFAQNTKEIKRGDISITFPFKIEI